jgi:hypothetical protein
LEDDEVNFFDKFMTDIKKGEGVSLESLTADVALEFTEIRATINNLLDLLEKKGHIDQDDRAALKGNVLKIVDDKLTAAAKKHPEIAAGIKEADKRLTEESKKER